MSNSLRFAALAVSVVLMLAVVAVQVELTELRLQLPKDKQLLFRLLEENSELQVDIDQLENPARLMALLEKPQYAHLKYPLAKEVVVLSDE